MQNNNKGNMLEPLVDSMLDTVALAWNLVPKIWDAWGNLIYRLVEGKSYSDVAAADDLQLTDNIKKYEYIPTENFDSMKLGDIAKYVYIEGDKEGVSAIVGLTLEGEYKEFDILEGHAMVGGASRWGKSSFLNVFITNVMLTYTPNEVIFLGCDYKFSDIYYYRNFEHWKKVATNKKEFLSMINKLNKNIEERAEILNNANCRNVIKYNSKSDTKLSYIIVVIDELVLLASDKEDPKSIDTKNVLHSMMSKCASYGIYFILASQDFTKDTIGKCKMNCSQTVGFHTKDETDSTTLIGKGHDLQDISVKGRCKIENSKGIEETQIFFLEEEDIEAYLKRFKKEV
ncbi:FtsK/SpoIIIE domain-containing protein [Clostridium sp.]|uniref:FtsK/SpoIIIE domain-containing protein n=1 Tax=Clostridium sp. TaxID=1506 RepID=UPI003F372DD2